jgi:hypothetical protein
MTKEEKSLEIIRKLLYVVKEENIKDLDGKDLGGIFFAFTSVFINTVFEKNNLDYNKRMLYVENIANTLKNMVERGL